MASIQDPNVKAESLHLENSVVDEQIWRAFQNTCECHSKALG